MKYPRASGALRRAPDPTLKRVRFARTMLLCTVGNLGLSWSGAPPDQILDPPLIYCYSIINILTLRNFFSIPRTGFIHNRHYFLASGNGPYNCRETAIDACYANFISTGRLNKDQKRLPLPFRVNADESFRKTMCR